MQSPLKLLFLSLLLIVSTACTTTFKPELSKVVYETSRASHSITLSRLNDSRQDKKIDRMYEQKPHVELEKLIKEKLLRSGIFKYVTTADDNPSNDQYKLEVTLNDLQLSFDNQKRHRALMMATGVLTAGLGALIYGSMNSENFHGETALHAKLIEQKSGSVVLDKLYETKQTQYQSLLKDSQEMRADLIGQSVTQMLNQLIADIENTIEDTQLSLLW